MHVLDVNEAGVRGRSSILPDRTANPHPRIGPSEPADGEVLWTKGQP